MRPEKTNTYQEILQLGEPSRAAQKLLNFLNDHFADESQNPEKRLLLEIISRDLIRNLAGSPGKLNDREIEQKASYQVTEAMLNYNKHSNSSRLMAN